MYLEADTRGPYTEAATSKTTPIQPGELAGIYDKINSIINLTSGTNDQLAYTVDRLLGGTDGSTNRPTSDSPQRSGEIGQIEAALDTLFRLAGRNSDLTSAISRL